MANAKANLDAQNIASGLGFMSNTAGFGVSQTMIPYSETDSYTRVFLVGLVNTLLVAAVGIFFATIIGFMVALGRLSPNWLISRISGGYVELVRNLPLLFQILFWYLAVLRTLPSPKQSVSVIRRHLPQQSRSCVPKPVGQEGLIAFSVVVVVAIIGCMLLRSYSRRVFSERTSFGRLAIRPWSAARSSRRPRWSFSVLPSRSKCRLSRDSIFLAARA